MKVCIRHVELLDEHQNSHALSEVNRLASLSRTDQIGVHQKVECHTEADLVIFVAGTAEAMFKTRRKQRELGIEEKSFVWCTGDRALPILPGVYASLDRSAHLRGWTLGGVYARVSTNDGIAFSSADRAKILYSFSGAFSNNRVRSRLAEISDDRAFIVDTSAMSRQARQRDSADFGKDSYIDSYHQLLKDSKFVLCPRGIGTSTWRLFETLKAGRVPVIISDKWVAPNGPDWGSCSVRIKEKHVSGIPRILRNRENDFPRMAASARETWNKWFSSDVLFHRIVEWCLSIKQDQKVPRRLIQSMYTMRLVQPHYFRHWLLADMKNRLLRS